MIEEYIAAAEVVEPGILKMTEASRAAMARAMKGFKRGHVDVIVRPHFVKRSSRANRYYHGPVLNAIVLETEQDHDSIHDVMCEKFIPPQTVTFVNKHTGETEERQVPGRSSRLSVSEFYHFVEQVRLWAAEWLGITIEDPDPEWRRLDEADEARVQMRRSRVRIVAKGQRRKTERVH